MHPEYLRMILQNRMIASVNTVILGKGQIKVLFPCANALQEFSVNSLFFFI